MLLLLLRPLVSLRVKLEGVASFDFYGRRRPLLLQAWFFLAADNPTSLLLRQGSPLSLLHQ